MIRKLTEAECRHAVENGDFPASTIGSAPAVALVMTQSWCHQWVYMRTYLHEAEQRAPAGGLSVRFVEYDKEPFFAEFMAHKEDVFGNRSVPYVRYYRDGAFAGDSNFVSLDVFMAKLGFAPDGSRR